jgi:predicted RNA-binding protein
MEKIKAEAIARARAQIAARIARFCKELSQEEFEALLDRMAGIHYKYECVQEIPPKSKRDTPAADAEQD